MLGAGTPDGMHRWQLRRHSRWQIAKEMAGDRWDATLSSRHLRCKTLLRSFLFYEIFFCGHKYLKHLYCLRTFLTNFLTHTNTPVFAWKMIKKHNNELGSLFIYLRTKPRFYSIFIYWNKSLYIPIYFFSGRRPVYIMFKLIILGERSGIYIYFCVIYYENQTFLKIFNKTIYTAIKYFFGRRPVYIMFQLIILTFRITTGIYNDLFSSIYVFTNFLYEPFFRTLWTLLLISS